MTSYQYLHVDKVDGVLTLTLDRPKVNAFNREMVAEFLDALGSAEGDETVRCLVLKGTGRYFCTGHDVGDMLEAGSGASYREHLERSYNRIINCMRRMPKPILGAINGTAAGAGLGIALATDLRWAAEGASFLFGFTGIGLTADSGVSLLLPLFVGMSRAMEMALTNRALTAQEALDCGLVSNVIPDETFAQSIDHLAATLARGPTRALGLSKRAFNRTMLNNIDDALAFEALLQEIAQDTADHKEGLAAFLEKRQPNFTGK